jgi:hypothetical protein
MNNFVDIDITRSTANFATSLISCRPTGNVIDNSWYNLIQTRSGQPYSYAIYALSEIVYWSRPRASNSNNLNSVPSSKFSGNAWQTSYAHFTKKFRVSHETIRKALVKLEELGAIKREFRNVKIKGQIFNNILFIYLGKNIGRFLSSNKDSGSKPFFSLICEDPYPHDKGHHISNKNKEREYRSDESTFVKSNLKENKKEDRSEDRRERDVKELMLNQEKAEHFILEKKLLLTKLVPINLVGKLVQDKDININKTKSHEPIKSFLNNNLNRISIHNSEGFDKRISYDTEDKKCRTYDRFQDTDLEDICGARSNNFNSNPGNACREDSSIRSNLTIHSNQTDLANSCTTKTVISEASALIAGEDKVKEPSNGLINKFINKFSGNRRKAIAELSIVTEEEAESLRISSEREFNLNYINKLVEKLGKKYPDHGFYTRAKFLEYLEKVLASELRHESVVNNETFRFRADIETNRIEKYLSQIEDDRSTDRISQLRKKIIAVLDKETAYRLLINCKFIGEKEVSKNKENADESEDKVFKIEISNQIELSEHQDKMLLDQIKAVYGHDIQRVEFKPMKTFNNNESNKKLMIDSLPLNLGKEGTIWNKVSTKLLEHYGERFHCSWFSKLEEVEGNKESISKLLLKAPSKFIGDWIKSNCIRKIEEFLISLGCEVGEVEVTV